MEHMTPTDFGFDEDKSARDLRSAVKKQARICEPKRHSHVVLDVNRSWNRSLRFSSARVLSLSAWQTLQAPPRKTPEATVIARWQLSI